MDPQIASLCTVTTGTATSGIMCVKQVARMTPPP